MHDRPRGVADVDVGPPELLAEDLEVAIGPEFAGELVDREVEAHPRRDSVDGREAQAGRAVEPGRRRGASSRSRPSARRRGRPAPAAPSSSTGTSGPPSGRSWSRSRRRSGGRRRRPRVLDELSVASTLISRASSGIARAGGVADDRREVDDRLGPRRRRPGAGSASRMSPIRTSAPRGGERRLRCPPGRAGASRAPATSRPASSRLRRPRRRRSRRRR